MTVFHILVALTMAMSLPVPRAQDRPASRGQLWTWFGSCKAEKNMGLGVAVNGTTIYRTSFPICPISDPAEETGPQQKTVVFHFKGGHVFQGEYRTAKTQTIEGNIWQAGADPDAILLGISFSTHNQVLLNTIHIAKPDAASRTEIDPGVVIRTFPIFEK